MFHQLLFEILLYSFFLFGAFQSEQILSLRCWQFLEVSFIFESLKEIIIAFSFPLPIVKSALIYTRSMDSLSISQIEYPMGLMVILMLISICVIWALIM